MSSTNDQERRRFHRFPFDVDCVLRVGTHSRLFCELRDLSINGASLKLEEPLHFDEINSGELELVIRGEVNGDIVVMEMEIEVVRTEGRLVGCRFRYVDFGSFASLKTLIAENMGDPLLLDRELTQLDYWPGPVAKSAS